VWSAVRAHPRTFLVRPPALSHSTFTRALTYSPRPLFLTFPPLQPMNVSELI